MKENKIKFHSIFYRYILFIVLLAITVLYVLSDGVKGSINFFDGTLIIERESLMRAGIVIFITSVVIFSFVNWKFYICKEGIYLRKIDLFVPWDDIVSVSHIWINQWDQVTVSKFFCYNRKTLVIYRKKYKPICIYNISLFALYAAKFYYSKLKTNIISATIATSFNVILNALIFYELWFNDLKDLQFNVFIIWLSMYAIKSLVLPLVIVKRQNKVHGEYLSHDIIYKKNTSNVIHL